ncbi:MAG: spore coat associated protein CotJA [Clostridia bacterium]|nr:spore coat associated protein CotJA [Clostridia bacterium]
MQRYANDDPRTPLERIRQTGGARAGRRFVPMEAAAPAAAAPQSGEAAPVLPRDCVRTPSLAAVYSPVQPFEGIYTPQEALGAGTLFAGLDKPFRGGMKG